MGPKRRSRILKERNLPIPLILLSSYIAAKKSDELIKEFCKELPGILENINSSKKALENRTRTVKTLKEDITQDLKKLELAKIVLNELYQEEEALKLKKEKELQELRSRITSNQNSKKILKNYLVKYSESQKELDLVAIKSNQYKDARHLIHTFLTLQAINEKFIEDECNGAYCLKDNEKLNFEIKKLSMKHKYDVLLKEEKLQNLENELQILQYGNYDISQSAKDISERSKNELLKNLQMKRWVQDVCQEISNYKETNMRTENFLKLLREIQEFMEFAREIIARLEVPH